MIIETRIPTYAFATLAEDLEAELKDTCQRFAKEMTFNIEYEYYSVYWHEHNWTMANIAMPGIDSILKRVP